LALALSRATKISRLLRERDEDLLITPRVVGTALDAERISDEMRRGTPELEDSFRRALRPLSPPPH
jgi:hypothetical protein